jgi:hypothetical protein
MFCFAKQKFLITSDNNKYPAPAFTKAYAQILFSFASKNFGSSHTLGEMLTSEHKYKNNEII